MKYICQITDGKVTKIQQVFHDHFPMNVVGYSSDRTVFPEECFLVAVEAEDTEEAIKQAEYYFRVSAIAFDREVESFNIEHEIDSFLNKIGRPKRHKFEAIGDRVKATTTRSIKRGRWENETKITTESRRLINRWQLYEFILKTIEND